MKNTLLLILGLLTSALGLPTLAQVPAFTYQGRLDADGAPASGIYDLRFTIHDAAELGTAQGNTLTNLATAVSNGLFTITLDFGVGVFTGAERWLEIGVRTNGTGAFDTLSPRQPILPSPYAIHAAGVNALGIAGTIPAAALSGTYGNTLDFTNPGNRFSGSGAGLTQLNASQLKSGLVDDARLPASVARTNQVWLLGGNTGTTPGVHFVGTSDSQPLEIKVNGLRGLRLEDNGDGSDFNTVPDGAPNFIGGSPANVVPAGVVGATIGGGGATNYMAIPRPNDVRADYGTVSGGLANRVDGFAATIAGGYDNIIGSNSTHAVVGGGNNNDINGNSTYAVVSGGRDNTVSFSSYSVIGGGNQNSIQLGNEASVLAGGRENTIASNAFWSVLAGGYENLIGVFAYHSVIGGGFDNGTGANAVGSTVAGGAGNYIRADAEWGAIGGGSGNVITNGARHATIPGGRENRATDFAFAAGRRAKANHPGAFVWADSTDSDFASTAANQFNIRAGGGARFETGGAGLTVDSLSVFTGNDGASLTSLNASQLASGTVPNARLSASVSLLGQTIESSEITDGTIQPADVNAASFSTTFWRIAGNGGTTAGTHFLGTTDSQPMEFKVNALRALRLEDKGDGSDSGTIPDGAPNILGGSPGNYVGEGVVGATIGGGGALNWEGFAQTNTVLSDYAVVGGGLANRIERDAIGAAIGGGRLNRIQTNSWFSHIGGGFDNTIASSNRQATIAGGSSNEIGVNSESSTVGGGVENYIASDSSAATIAGGNANDIGSSSDHSTVGGGYRNNISSTSASSTIAGGVSNDIGVNSFYSSIGGGSDNNIGNNAIGATVGGGVSADLGNGATYSTVGGGYDNNIAASGQYATIPGGAFNSAANYAFAAGYRAKANHQGAFVWADSTTADFASTTANQFNVRATGGARFVTSGAGLTVDGDVGIGETAPDGQLHITGGPSTPQIKIETTTTDSFVKLRLESFGKPHWDFAVGGSDNVMNWYYSAIAQNLMSLSTSGTLTTAGPVNPPSDRNVKQDFAAVDALAVLERVAALPIQTWAYKNSPETRHIGPVAQDFHAAFQFNGDDDKHISTVDADGVALAAIQGLNQKVEDRSRRAADQIQKLEADLKRRDAENAALQQRVAMLEQLMTKQHAGTVN